MAAHPEVAEWPSADSSSCETFLLVETSHHLMTQFERQPSFVEEDEAVDLEEEEDVEQVEEDAEQMEQVAAVDLECAKYEEEEEEEEERPEH